MAGSHGSYFPSMSQRPRGSYEQIKSPLRQLNRGRFWPASVEGAGPNSGWINAHTHRYHLPSSLVREPGGLKRGCFVSCADKRWRRRIMHCDEGRARPFAILQFYYSRLIPRLSWGEKEILLRQREKSLHRNPLSLLSVLAFTLSLLSTP